MQSTSIRMYVGFVTALTAASLFLVDWTSLDVLSTEAWTGFLSLIILGLVSESVSLPIRIGANESSSSISFLPLLACVLLFGPVPAIIFYGAIGTFGEITTK